MFASGLGLAIWVASSLTGGVRIQVGTPIWNSDCAAHFKNCVADLPVVLENTNEDRSITVEGFEITGPPWYGYQRRSAFAVAPRIVGPASVFQHHLNAVKDTEYTMVVRAVVRFRPGRVRLISSQPFVLTNASREAARQACQRDRGDWRRNWSGRPYCLPRTPDGGKICRDGVECKGLCVFDGREPVGSPEGRFQRQKWRLVGHCSEFLMGLGCYEFIANGASGDPPRDYLIPPAMVCSD
jgi:hypothetical protein